MTTIVKFEDSESLEDGVKRTTGNTHPASHITRTIKQEPESAAAVAMDDDLISDDGMDGIEVRSEPELERTPNDGGDSDDGVTRCSECQTTATKIWYSRKRWNLLGKLCKSCYLRWKKTVPKVVVSRECADCGIDDSDRRKFCSGARWSLQWLCSGCHRHRVAHNGEPRPSDEVVPDVTCANCGARDLRLPNHRHVSGALFGIKGKLCYLCYRYHQFHGAPRPENRWVKPTLLGHCPDCGIEEPRDSHWRRGTRWGIERKLCDTCYRYRSRGNNDGQAKPKVHTCAKCGTEESTRWFKAASMNLPGLICGRCEWVRTHPNISLRANRPQQCVDCHTNESSVWKSSARWGPEGVRCSRCYTHRDKHDGKPRSLAHDTPHKRVPGPEADEDEIVPPPAKRRRTARGKFKAV